MTSRRSLSERGTLVLAGSAWSGAVLARPFPWLVAAGLVGLAWLLRRPALLVVGVALLASGLADLAVVGARPQPARLISGEATVVSDPVSRPGSVRADIRYEGQRFELVASGSAAGVLRQRLAGEGVRLEGRSRPRSADAVWLERRHVVGQVEVTSAADLAAAGSGDVASMLANRYRRLLADGAESLEPRQRALFTGFVFGDDREVPPDARFDFRASGLSHLLAVSGANVAFVLAVASPVLRRLGLWPRLAGAVGVLVFFALLTRAEPSVLRATAMAIVATGAATFGWPVSAVRVLALAVTGVILVDPLLVGSLAFQLSVAAAAGIIVLARPIAERLRGPRPLRDAMSVAVAAQIAVAPLLIPAFGGIPVVAIPANVLAAPAAGPIMVWGLTAGTLAGVVGGPIATILHLPTRLLLGWVSGIAQRASSAPLGDIGAGHLVALAVLLAVIVVADRGWLGRVGRRARAGATVGVVGCVLAAAVVLPTAPVGTSPISTGADLTVSSEGSAVLVVDGRVRTDELLTGLRALGVRALDLLVVRTGSRSATSTAHVLLRRLAVGTVVAPAVSGLPGAVVPDAGSTLSMPGIAVEVVAVGETLDVSISTAPGVASAGARSSRRRVPDHLGARGPPLRHHPPSGGDGHPQPDARLLLRQGQLLGVRRLPPQGRDVGGRWRRLPRRRGGQGRAG